MLLIIKKKNILKIINKEYNKPIYGCTMNEFIDTILENAKEFRNENKTK